MEETLKKILIVDDEPNIHYSLQRVLSSDYIILSAENAEEGIRKVKEATPDLIVMDVRLPGMDGLEALQHLRDVDAKIPVIVMTAYGSVDTAIKAMKFGAYEYLLKPFKVDKMRQVIQRALTTGELMRRAVYYRVDLSQVKDLKGDVIVGSSEAMQGVYKLIGQVAEQNVTVLLRGESGTGKELVARAIYQHSKRADRPFLAVNCAALPETLLESELFGYEKGAFTGAMERHIGKFEQVNGGTMFLDEIGDMSLLTQTKILRVMQNGEFTRVGGKEVIRTDVRLIVATNRNLEEAIRAGKFREDLYYRLNIITINLPTLRDRKEDIPELVNYFVARFSLEMNKVIKGIDKKALKQIQNYDWPGNVRQLENCIRRAVILAKGNTITPEDLQIESSYVPEMFSTEKTDVVEIEKILDHIISGKNNMKLLPTVEKLLITKALQKTKGNQVQAARLLGINRNTLRKRIQKYGITI